MQAERCLTHLCVVGYCRTGAFQNHYDRILPRCYGHPARFRCYRRAQLQQYIVESSASKFILGLHCGYIADVRTWHANVEQHASDDVNKILVGNKCDSEDSKKQISNQQAQELAEELGIPYLETSAKSAINTDEAFFTLAR